MIVQRLNSAPIGPFRTKAEADAAAAGMRAEWKAVTPKCRHKTTIVVHRNGKIEHVCTNCDRSAQLHRAPGWTQQYYKCEHCGNSVIKEKYCGRCSDDLIPLPDSEKGQGE